MVRIVGNHIDSRVWKYRLAASFAPHWPDERTCVLPLSTQRCHPDKSLLWAELVSRWPSTSQGGVEDKPFQRLFRRPRDHGQNGHGWSTRARNPRSQVHILPPPLEMCGSGPTSRSGAFCYPGVHPIKNPTGVIAGQTDVVADERWTSAHDRNHSRQVLHTS
jgi:hypothetical protein